MAIEPTLNAATVLFHTNDDDKDGNTHVTVTVRQGDGRIAARVDNNFGHFNDNSDNGPFGLTLFHRGTIDDLSNGNVTLRMDPVGNDEWHTNVFVDLTFSDGSHLAAEAEGLKLVNEHPQATFNIG